MIIEFRCSNYRSIGEDIVFSMVATQDNALPENYVETEEKRILKEAVVYGANGSGKSNFLKAIMALKNYIVGSIRNQPGDSLQIEQNLLNMDKPVSFYIHFTKNSNRYAYYLSVGSEGVEEEFLYHFPRKKKALIFERKKDVVNYGELFKKELTLVVRQFIQSNRLVLSIAANYSSIEEIKDAFIFFNNDLIIYSSDNPEWKFTSTKMMQNSPQMRDSFVEFMRVLGDNSIRGVESKIENVEISEKDIPPFFSEEIKKIIRERGSERLNVRINYDKFSVDLDQESLGIQKLFSFYPLFKKIVDNNMVLLIDEFDSHLHSLIVKKLIELFENEKTTAQLIFTAHDINLLDLSLFRRDQIWFTNIYNENRYTELFSLAEVKSVRNNENVSKNYLLGKYNGIPVISNKKKIDLMEQDYEH